MGVVRIDDELEKEIEQVLNRPENKYRYPSKTAFLNILIHESMLKMEKAKDKEKKR